MSGTRPLRIPLSNFRLALILAVALAVPLSAAQGPPIPGKWRNLGPDGGVVLSLAVHPKNPLVVYAGGWGGVFRSVDGGENWVAANRGLSSGALLSVFVGVNCLAIDPASPFTIYAGRDSDGVVRSTDGGATWTHIGAGLSERGVAALALTPGVPNQIFAAADGGVFRTVDGGATWQHLTRGLPPSLVEGLTVVADPVSPQIVYAVLSETNGTTSRVFKSVTGGTTWNDISSGALNGRFVYKLVVAPSSHRTLYAGTYGGVFKSTDGGGSWQATTLAGFDVHDLAVHPSLPGTVYAGTRGGVFRTTDGGGHWSPMNQGLVNTGVPALALAPSLPRVLYAATFISVDNGSPGGVFKSRDSARSWQFSSHGLSALSVHAFAIDPRTPSTLWLSNYAGLFKSTDRGVGWAKIELPSSCAEPNGRPYDIDIDPAEPATTYLLISSGKICRTRDGGATWEALRTGFPASGLWLDPRSPSTLYAFSRGLWRSTDRGTTWSPLGGAPDQLEYASLLLSPSSPGTWYVLGYPPAPSVHYQLLRTTDGGSTWVKLPIGNEIDSLAIDPARATKLYQTANGDLFKSIDGGNTWSLVSNTFHGRSGSAITIDPAAPKNLYLSVWTDKVYESTDRGVTWRPLGDGPDHVLSFSLTLAPKDPRRIYLGTSGGALIEFTKKP